MELKPGVCIDGLKSPLKDKLLDIEAVCIKNGSKFVITAGTDGKHKPNSKHYDGLAIDIRTWWVKDRIRFRRDMQEMLGPEYDCVLEKTHLHVEHDPKTSHTTMQA